MTAASITFDRATGSLAGAGLLERAAVAALRAGSKVTRPFEHRGYSLGCRAVAAVVAEREIIVRLSDDAVFAFPLGDAYWSRMLNRSYIYEEELHRFLSKVASADYVFIDCGANFGIWSVLATSRAFGSHRAVAIEASPANAAKLARNAALNDNRFAVLNRAIGGESGGKARISGRKHEALSIISDGGPQSAEEVDIISLDSLLDDGTVKPGDRMVIKLDVEGVEIAALKGGRRMLAGDVVVVCEEHGSDRNHTLTRYLITETACRVYMLNPASRKFEQIRDVAALDRMNLMSWVGYNVFATASAFWEERLLSMVPLAAVA